MLTQIISLIAAIFFIHLSSATQQVNKSAEMQAKYGDKLQKIFDVQKSIQDIHPFLHNLFPIAIVEDGTYFVFDLDSTKQSYKLVKEAPVTTEIPKGIRASYPLNFYDNKPACIVTGDVFNDLKGYVTIFHEFIHCNQYETVELKLKRKLTIYQDAMANKDYMWEIAYPFPYKDSLFIEYYSQFLQLPEKDPLKKALSLRTRLKNYLSIKDYEYMVWLEWKEGFARFNENRMRKELNLEKNDYGVEPPYHRVTFYIGGEKYITLLEEYSPGLINDVGKLFSKMMNPE